jgi:iron complex transport system substrate-binding protein
MIEDFDRRLAKATGQASGARPTAVAMQVNSLASGPGSLVDEVLTAGGFDNIARVAESQGKLGPGGRLPLETLLLAPPDIIVLANSPADFRTVLGDNLRHPAFTRLAAGRPSVHLPMRTWLCGTPAIVEAVEKLAALRAALADGKRSAP